MYYLSEDVWERSKSDCKWSYLGEGSQARHLTGRDQPHGGQTEDMMDYVSEARGEDKARPAACLCVVCMVNSQRQMSITLVLTSCQSMEGNRPLQTTIKVYCFGRT